MGFGVRAHGTGVRWGLVLATLLAPRVGRAAESVDPRPLTAPPTAFDRGPPADLSWSQRHRTELVWTGRVSAALGSAALLTGVVLGAISEAGHRSVASSPELSQVDALRRRNRANRLGTAANYLLIVGGALTATGSGILMWDWLGPDARLHVDPCGRLPRGADCTPTLDVRGIVIDAGTREPIAGAVVVIRGALDSELRRTTDTLGRFAAEPRNEGELLRIVASAPGRMETEVVVSATDRDTLGALRLTMLRDDANGIVRGRILDAMTGAPVRATLDIQRRPASEAPPPTAPAVDPSGTFETRLRPARYLLGVSAPGYEPQHKNLVIEPGVVVIWNVDLHRRAR